MDRIVFGFFLTVLNSAVTIKGIDFRRQCVEWRCQSLEFTSRFSMQLDYQSSYVEKREWLVLPSIALITSAAVTFSFVK